MRCGMKSGTPCVYNRAKEMRILVELKQKATSKRPQKPAGRLGPNRVGRVARVSAPEKQRRAALAKNLEEALRKTCGVKPRKLRMR